MRFHRSTRRVAIAITALALSGLVGLPSPAGAAPATVAAPCSVPKAKAGARPLDTRPIGAAEVRRLVEAAPSPRLRAATLPDTVTINVRAHVLKSTNPERPYATTQMIADQIALLNRAYSGDEATGQTPTNNPVTRYRFRLYSTDTTVNTAWDWAAQGSRQEYDMKRALRKGWPYGLNLYFVNQTVSSQVLGYSTFPWDRARYPRQDGVVINVRAMPGGDYADFNEGDTATHEIGHWMGLLHTFQGGCSDPNDGVTDTPRERDASSGCPEGADTCVYNPGVDPIHNFMDYSVDACMWEFTAGQAERMDAMWTQYRAS